MLTLRVFAETVIYMLIMLATHASCIASYMLLLASHDFYTYSYLMTLGSFRHTGNWLKSFSTPIRSTPPWVLYTLSCKGVSEERRNTDSKIVDFLIVITWLLRARLRGEFPRFLGSLFIPTHSAYGELHRARWGSLFNIIMSPAYGTNYSHVHNAWWHCLCTIQNKIPHTATLQANFYIKEMHRHYM